MAEDSLYGYRKNDEGVGLFIDWENIKIGLNDKYGLTPDIGELLESIDRFGQRGVSRAYANWQQHKHLHDDQSKFLMRAVETVQILGRNPHSGRVIKNSADVALAVEAVRLCYTQPDITTFVLVTGDGDLVHLVNELKRNRNRVIIVGVDMSISKVLVEAADEVLVYETDIEPKRFAEVLEKLRNSGGNSLRQRDNRDSRDTRSNNSRQKTNTRTTTKSRTTNNNSSSSTKKDVDENKASAWIIDILKNNPDGLSTSNLGHHLWKKHKFTAKDIDMSLEEITTKLIDAAKVQQEENTLKLPPKVSKLNLDTVDKTQQQVWLTLEELMDEQSHVTLKVIEKSEDGISVDVESLNLPNYDAIDAAITAFVPKSQLDTKRVESVNDITDSELELRILELEPEKSLVTLSRSAVIAANYVNKTKGKTGGKTETKTTASSNSDANTLSHTLSELQEGEVITAKVTKLMPYGVFVDSGKNVKGLVHISELSTKQIRHPKQVVSVGEELDLKVLSVDTDKEHIALSLIAAQADNPSSEKKQKEPDTQPVDYTWEEIVEKYPEGTEVEGTISNKTPFGVFVALEPGLSALMHISELGKKNTSAFRRGNTIKAVVANLDHDKQRFSLKPLDANAVVDNATANKKDLAAVDEPSDAKSDAKSDSKLDAIEQFKLNTENEEDVLVLDTEAQASDLKNNAPLDIGYDESPEDAEYGQVFSTNTSVGNLSESDLSEDSLSTSEEASLSLNEPDELANFTEEEVALYRLIASVKDGGQNIISLNDLYQEFAKKHASQGNLQDFKLLIKQGHESGWLKLLRHSEDKGLYVQLNNQGDKD